MDFLRIRCGWTAGARIFVPLACGIAAGLPTLTSHLTCSKQYASLSLLQVLFINDGAVMTHSEAEMLAIAALAPQSRMLSARSLLVRSGCHSIVKGLGWTAAAHRSALLTVPSANCSTRARTLHAEWTTTFTEEWPRSGVRSWQRRSLLET
jgi:hypothetical protein